MKNYFVAVLFSAIALILTLSSVSNAQLTRGAVVGTIRDQSGSVIPGANVTVVNNETKFTRNETTNNDGFFRIGALEPGNYSVTVEKNGFTKAENKSLDVATATEVTFDVNLQVGDVGATVDITAETEAITLNKTNATVGTTIDNRRVVELPTGAGRNINNLALLSPNTFAAPGSTGISANGQRARNNNFLIDGSDNNDITITQSTSPLVPEAVGEFQIQTNPYSAEFGRNSGAAINVITKSGSNALHGDVFDYYRGSDLNALSNIEKSAGLTSPSRFNRNQFGFDVGGPVFGPNFGEGTKPIYNGRNRTYFFYTFQGDRIRTGSTVGGTIRIPTPAGFASLNNVSLRAGQSAASRQTVLQQLGFLRGIYSQRVQFRNLVNQCINRTQTAALDPNCTTGTLIETGQTNVGIVQNADTYFNLVRLDHKISGKDNITGRYIINKSNQPNVASNLSFGPLFAGAQTLSDQNLAISEAHVFNSSLINEFRFSYIRRNLNFPENDTTTPSTTIGGLFSFGGASNFPQSRITNYYQFADTVSYALGRNNLKFGFDIRRNILANFSGFDVKGTFGFNSLQDYLNNNAATFTQATSVANFDAKQTQQFYFAQDDFRVTPSLTLNLGLRYEVANVPFGFFGSTDATQNAALIPRPVKTDKNNFAPVVGFAYSPKFENGVLGKVFGDGLTVFRGGYRTAYDVLFFNILTVNAGNFPITTSIQQTNVLDVFPTLAPANSQPVFNPTAGFVNSPTNLKNPESYLYSFSVQREIAKQLVIEAGYTGSRSINQINQLQANAAVLTQAQINNVLGAQRSGNSFVCLDGRTVTAQADCAGSAQSRRIFSQFGARTLIASTAQATYNAGYVSIKKRFANNLTFDFAYTRSKLLSDNDESLGVAGIAGSSPQVPQDYSNYKVEKSVSAFDRPNRFVFNFLYEVPLYGFLKNNAVTKAVLGGFQISGITQFQSGQPFTIITGVDSNGNGTSGGDRPNYNPNGIFLPDPLTGNLRTFTSPLVGGRFVVPLGTNNLPLANSLGNGNLGKNTLRAPGYYNTDFSVLKRFRLPFGKDDRKSLIVRADFLNLFNQDNYGIPVNNLNSLDFGKNLNNWGNRSITLSGKFSF